MTLIEAIVGIFSYSNLYVATWGMATSFVLCVILVLTKWLHGSLTMDHMDGVQKSHIAPAPRIGGVPIVLGLLFACNKATLDVQALIAPILIAGMPAFIFGVLEDITKRVSIMHRLMATIVSGLLACYITGYSISRVDVWGLDYLLSFTLVSVAFTAFAVGGAANSINIIDGFNGLASTMIAIALFGFALISWQVGDTLLASTAFVLASCVFGFFWVNWPLGKIFLGDGGAYFLGFSVAWVAVMLVERNPGVSAFAALLICLHPITEVLFSIYRRWIKHLNPGHPDRLHFHSLLKQRYVRRWFSGHWDNAHNSITGLLIGLMTLPAVIIAALVHNNILLSFSAVFCLFIGYTTIYARMVRFTFCSPFKFVLIKPAPLGKAAGD
jgi:UDP-N-acetylmuramyl pentapeptide phosphotransferase/UDP-N-acetylglucosamine-1-phosphate transferase